MSVSHDSSRAPGDVGCPGGRDVVHYWSVYSDARGMKFVRQRDTRRSQVLTDICSMFMDKVGCLLEENSGSSGTP